MKIVIQVDVGLVDLSAELCRTSYVTIPAVVRFGEVDPPTSLNARDVFGKSFALRLVESGEREPGVLFVSPGVKRLFYVAEDQLDLV